MSTYADAVMAIARGSACYAAKVRVSQTQPWHRAVLSPLGILHTHDQQQQADDTATSNFPLLKTPPSGHHSFSFHPTRQLYKLTAVAASPKD